MLGHVRPLLCLLMFRRPSGRWVVVHRVGLGRCVVNEQHRAGLLALVSSVRQP